MKINVTLESFACEPAAYIKKWMSKTYAAGPAKVWAADGQSRNKWCYERFGLSYMGIYCILRGRRGVGFSTLRRICEARGLNPPPVVYKMLKFAEKSGLTERMQNETGCGYTRHFIKVKTHTMDLTKYIACLNWLHKNTDCDDYGRFLDECAKNFA